ncbi:MAG: lytic transglycosylase domain-containing protein [Archangium sp.]|nr:lytic transglycosylase domain-containing protein [Archangium sp.]
MDPAHTLSAVSTLEAAVPAVPAVTGAPRSLSHARLLAASLGLNTVLGVGMAAAALTFHQQLEQLSLRAQQDAAANERHLQSLAALADQSTELQAGLVDVRTAVSSHAREESLFLKMLILKPSLDQTLARRIARSVQSECLLFGQDPNLVLAIMVTESDFNPNAVSNQGATGLMQVMPHWKKVLGLQELTEPEVSIRAGIQILGFYQQMYRDLDLAVTAYNRGPGPVDGALVRGASPANGYAAKVLGTYEKLKSFDVAARP